MHGHIGTGLAVAGTLAAGWLLNFAVVYVGLGLFATDTNPDV